MIYAVLLLALLALNLYLNESHALLLLAAAVVLPILSILLCRRAKDTVSMTLEPVEQAGEEEPHFRGTLRNSSAFPAAVVRGALSVQNALTGTAVEQTLRASVAGKGEKSVRFLVEEPEVGKLFATVTDLTVQDLFGLVSYPVRQVAPAELLILPPDVPADVQMMQALETSGESVRYSEHEKGHDVSELFDLRDYVPGDDVRSIHWNLTAKQDKPILREFSQPLNYSVILLVELAKSSADALQACVTYASAISKGLLEAGVLHTLVWYDAGTDTLEEHNITGEEERAMAELRLLSSACHEGPDLSLDRFLDVLGTDPTSTLLYLTPCLQTERIARVAVDMPVRLLLIGAGEDMPVSLAMPSTELPETVAPTAVVHITV